MTDQKRMTNVLSEIMQITDTTCLRTIQSTARERRDSLVSAAMADVKKGDPVQLLPEHQDSRPFGTIGKVIKVNPKRFRIDFGAYGYFNVPKSMVKKA